MYYRVMRLLLIALIIGGLGYSVPGVRAAEGRPILVIPSPRYDAGSLWEGEKVSHTFEVKNTGSATLRIFNVQPG